MSLRTLTGLSLAVLLALGALAAGSVFAPNPPGSTPKIVCPSIPTRDPAATGIEGGRTWICREI